MGDDFGRQTDDNENNAPEQKTVSGDGAVSHTKLKVVSWNINGMRTLNMQEILKQLDASIVMVQETKLTRVATFCKDEWTPSKAEEGICLRNPNITDNVGCYPEFTADEESHVKFANADGRAVITQHNVQLPDGNQQPLTLINVYCPRLRDDPEDLTNNTDFKMIFHALTYRRARLLVENGSFVILAGDINISHRWIDHCDGDPKTFVVNEFRKQLDDFLAEDKSGFVDSFRMFFPEKRSAFTCWNTRLNARENNYGTRIDYIFVDKQLAKYLESAEIHPDVMGSDHCPISAVFHTLKPVSSKYIPSFATKYYPEFRSKQTNLKEFIQTSSKCIKMDTKVCENSLCQLEVTKRKRPLSCDSSSKYESSKRVQTSLKSYFVQNSSVESSRPPEDVPAERFVENKGASSSANKASEQWKRLMKAPETPLCQGHKEPCVKRTVKKKGMNFGREFWSCPHGIGKSDDPNASCNFFQWVKPTRNEK